MKRVLTALLLVPVATYIIFYGHPILFIVITAGVAGFCFIEFANIAKAQGSPINTVIGFLAGMLVLWMPTYEPVLLTIPILLAMALATRSGKLAEVLPQTAALALGVIYCYGPWRCAIGLRALSPHWLFYGLAVNWVGDIAAYYVGSRFGKRKLAPQISPGKSWEGAIASMAASVVFGLVFLHRFSPEKAFDEVLALTVLANAAGQVGDLCESALKRGSGIKDSGAMLPGHGGWLDRLDASLFTLPVVYLWVSRLSVML